MSEWSTMPLGEICREGGGFIRTGPFGSQLHRSDYTADPCGIPVVMPKDMASGRIDTTSIARIDVETASRLKQHLLTANDVVLSRRGDVGRTAWVFEDDLPAFCGTGAIRVHLGESEAVRPGYLRFFFHTKLASDYLEGHAVGATMPNLNSGIVERMPVPIPPVPVQDSLIAVLEAFDELIENSRRRVEVLEQMARTIYREWFVKFRYPGHADMPMVDSDFGEIPEGWYLGKIGDLCSRVQAGSTPRRSTREFWDDPSVDWYKTGDLADGILLGSSEQISDSGLNAGRSFAPETILMAIYGSPTVGRLGLLSSTASANQAALGLVANPEACTTEFLWFTLEYLRGHLNGIAQGAAQQNVSKEKVVGCDVLIPPRELVAEFTRVAGPIWRHSHQIATQTVVLARLRDVLLPKLVTGQIEVSDLDLEELVGTGLVEISEVA